MLSVRTFKLGGNPFGDSHGTSMMEGDKKARGLNNFQCKGFLEEFKTKRAAQLPNFKQKNFQKLKTTESLGTLKTSENTKASEFRF